MVTKIIKSRGFLLLVIIVLVLISVKSCYRNHQEIKEITRNNEILKEESEKWKDESGAWRAKARTATGTINTLKATHQSRLDSIVKEYEIKLSDLKSSTSVGTETEIDVSIPLEPIYNHNLTPVSLNRELNFIGLDNEVNRKFRVSNKWYNISGIIYSEKVDLSINVYDSISFITFWERDKWFKKKELKVEAKSYNPFTKINFVENIQVSDRKRPRFAIVAFAGIGVGQSLNLSPTLGVGLGYTLFEF